MVKSEFLSLRDQFDEVWLVDTEYSQPPGERPRLHCLVGHELFSGTTLRWWHHEGAGGPPAAPISGHDRCLFVAYYASAELGCYRSVGWPYPTHVIDLYAEFRCVTSGRTPPSGHSLLGALVYFKLPGIERVEKESMQQLAIHGGPYTDVEQFALLDYCQSDVEAVGRLLSAMWPQIDLPCALLRGRYVKVVADMEWCGVPVDAAVLDQLRERWSDFQAHLIGVVDREFNVYEGARFKAVRWEAWLADNHVAWPRLASGALKLDDDTFKEVGRSHPAVERMRQLRLSLSKLRLQELPVGTDGRNRVLLSPFASRTGRNQPSTAKFIFGPAVWIRSLIKPAPQMALAYLDYEQQEFGIAAALSDDGNMKEAYASGDPYLEFARQAAAVPSSATKESHPRERELFKSCALGVQYGMGETTMAARLGISAFEARDLLDLHRRVFRRYWQWSDAAQDFAMLHGYLEAVFGWKVHVVGETNPRSLRNFPLQANGAEMLRLACCLAADRGVCLCAPVHDALLIEAPAGEIDGAVDRCAQAMREASRVVLEGFELRVESETIRHPERFHDSRGATMWQTVTEFLEAEQEQPVLLRDRNLSRAGTDVPYPLCLL